ncbi:hypothetical protein CPJCM30710_29040 [Clostridium polyendosporum]|uniref:Uncharacterized protein n=1 Tax=Clostridium polyendosporum TaxID=69208 RepID=A0A919S2X0_9CLOT|nr:glycosyltransferase [Clostridium polyendosporum]GIM30238.1 hypothetical protein CPJCM30710_29040 [Clostridium polyendosporum]
MITFKNRLTFDFLLDKLLLIFLITFPLQNFAINLFGIGLLLNQFFLIILTLLCIYGVFKKNLEIPYGMLFVLLLVSINLLSLINAVNYIGVFKKLLKILLDITVYFTVYNLFIRNKADQASSLLSLSQISLREMTANKRKDFFNYMIYIGLFISIYTIIEWGFAYFGLSNFLFNIEGNYQGVIRADGTFTDANYLGAYLVPIFLLALNKWIYQYKLKVNLSTIIYLVTMLSSVAATFVSLSRGATLSIVIGFVISISIYLLKDKKRRKAFYYVLLSMVLIFIIAIIVFKDSLFVKRLLSAFNFSRGDVNVRFKIWNVAFAMIKDHPLLGIGAGNFVHIFSKYNAKIPPFVAHNSLLEITAETGIFALIVMVILIVKFLKMSVVNVIKIKENFEEYWIVASLLPIMICSIFSSLTLSNIFYQEIFWFYLAGVIYYRNLKEGNLIRILQVILSSHIAGTEKHIIDLVRKLDKSKFQVDVICCGGTLEEKFKSMGVKVHTIQVKGNKDLRAIIDLYKLIKKENYDIVHNHLSISTLMGTIAARLAGVKTIITTEHLWSSFNEEMSMISNKIHLFIHRLLSLFITKIIAVANAVKSFLVDNAYFDENKIVVIHNCIGDECVEEKNTNLREELNIKEEDVLLGIVGRLSYEKGHLLLLEAFSKIDNKNVKLIIVGDGELKDDITDKISELNINDRVIMFGFTNDVQSVYEAIDILVLTSYRECLPLVLLEAMSHKKPCIASNVGGVSEIISHGNNGLLVKPKSTKELKKAIEELSSNEALRISMGNEGYEIFLNDFRHVDMVKKTENLYIEMNNR